MWGSFAEIKLNNMEVLNIFMDSLYLLCYPNSAQNVRFEVIVNLEIIPTLCLQGLGL